MAVLAAAGCAATVASGPPPDMVYVSRGVQVIADYDEPIVYPTAITGATTAPAVPLLLINTGGWVTRGLRGGDAYRTAVHVSPLSAAGLGGRPADRRAAARGGAGWRADAGGTGGRLARRPAGGAAALPGCLAKRPAARGGTASPTNTAPRPAPAPTRGAPPPDGGGSARPPMT